MERREFFKNIGNLGALSAGAAALSVFSQQAHTYQQKHRSQQSRPLIFPRRVLSAAHPGPSFPAFQGPGKGINWAMKRIGEADKAVEDKLTRCMKNAV